MAAIIKLGQCFTYMAWLGGNEIKVLDSWSRGRGFKSHPVHCRLRPGHSRTPASVTKQLTIWCQNISLEVNRHTVWHTDPVSMVLQLRLGNSRSLPPYGSSGFGRRTLVLPAFASLSVVLCRYSISSTLVTLAYHHTCDKTWTLRVSSINWKTFLFRC